MATVKAVAVRRNYSSSIEQLDVLGIILGAALPVFAFVSLAAACEFYGMTPLFFAPFGLPGWMAGAMHIATLPLLGVASWLVLREGGEGNSAAAWIAAVTAGMICFPFLVSTLDSLQLSMASMALLLAGISAATRASKVSRLAWVVMMPALGWMGLSAFLGLSFVAAWAPPFGLTHSAQNAA